MGNYSPKRDQRKKHDKNIQQQHQDPHQEEEEGRKPSENHQQFGFQTSFFTPSFEYYG